MKEGKLHGHGIVYYKNGKKRYDGSWKEAKFHGQGIVYYENGNIEYEGKWEDGKENP